MLTNRRAVIAATFALTVSVPAAGHAFVKERVFTREQFGATGDGRTNDSLAMARLAEAVNLYGGATVVFRKVNYVIGAQGLALGSPYMFPPRDLLAFRNCTLPLELRGNGARLVCEPGLRYGTFGANGEPVHHPMPYLGSGLASPYAAMVSVERCRGKVRITDLEPGHVDKGQPQGN